MSNTPIRQSLPQLVILGLAVVLLTAGAVYLIERPLGNGGSAGDAVQSVGAPTPDAALADKLADFATGSMANFRPTKGAPALPDLAFQDGVGKAIKLSDFRGKVLLLNVWATWCAPCREEMPALDALEGAMGDARFQVVALNVDHNGLELARSFLSEVGIEHLSLFNEPTLKASFALKTVGLPTTILVSADGRELGRLVGPAAWNTPEAQALIKAATGS